VSLSLANDAASLPVAYRLYLPKDWAEDNERRCKAGIPEEIGFKTKPEIALEQIQWACETDLPGDLVLIDAGYSNASKLRAGITELGKLYAAGIQSQTLVSKPGPRRGRAAKKGRRDASVKELAIRLRAKAGHTIAWREGTNVNGQLCYSASHEYSLRHSRRACAGWVIILPFLSRCRPRQPTKSDN
jgi:SRSO17 transposase